MEFKYSGQDLVEFVKKGLGHEKLEASNRGVLIPGLRGVTLAGFNKLETNENEPDRYNDTLCPIYFENPTTTRHETVICTVEPGAHYTRVDPHPKGAARLPLCRMMEFKWGKHRGRTALVPVHADVVVRDANGNFHIDPAEKVHIGNFQLRIHSGGKNPKSVGKYSAGCIAILGGEDGVGWRKLVAICQKNTQDKFYVILAEGDDFRHWIVHREEDRLGEFRATIHIGSRGEQVELLQELLNERHGYDLKTDGDFGIKTRDAFIAAQRKAKFKSAGECGLGQWERLQGKLGPYYDERSK